MAGAAQQDMSVLRSLTSEAWLFDIKKVRTPAEAPPSMGSNQRQGHHPLAVSQKPYCDFQVVGSPSAGRLGLSTSDIPYLD